jgi:hypothetical protein
MKKENLLSISVISYPDGRLDCKNAALYLGLKEKTLAMMRGNGTGPKFIKRGRVFYYQDDLDNWLNAKGKHTSTAQAQLMRDEERS